MHRRLFTFDKDLGGRIFYFTGHSALSSINVLVQDCNIFVHILSSPLLHEFIKFFVEELLVRLLIQISLVFRLDLQNARSLFTIVSTSFLSIDPWQFAAGELRSSFLLGLGLIITTETWQHIVLIRNKIDGLSYFIRQLGSIMMHVHSRSLLIIIFVSNVEYLAREQHHFLGLVVGDFYVIELTILVTFSMDIWFWLFVLPLASCILHLLAPCRVLLKWRYRERFLGVSKPFATFILLCIVPCNRELALNLLRYPNFLRQLIIVEDLPFADYHNSRLLEDT